MRTDQRSLTTVTYIALNLCHSIDILDTVTEVIPVVLPQLNKVEKSYIACPGIAVILGVYTCMKILG